MATQPALRRYNRTVLVLGVLYATSLVGVEWLFRRHLLHGAVAYVSAALPALPIVGIFAAIGRYLLEEQDEYIRMLTARRALIASGFALSLATVWGFLESFGLVRHVDAYYVAVLWFAGLGVGACINCFAAGPNYE